MAPAGNVFSGREDSNLARPFNGLIDEVEIYGRALSAAEIQGIVTAGGAGKCKGTTGGGGSACLNPPSNGVSWWAGDGNANDANAVNNGTVQGGTSFAAGQVGQAFQ